MPEVKPGDTPHPIVRDARDDSIPAPAQSQLSWLRDAITNPWFLVIALVVIFAGLSQLTGKSQSSALPTSEAQFPMVYMEGLNIREYGAQGHLHHQLAAATIVQFQVNPDAPSSADHYRMAQPVFTFYENQVTPWQVTAQRAQGLVGDKTIELLDDVLIQQDLPEHGLMTLTTTRLMVESATQLAHTDAPIQLQNQRATIDAVGLNANLQDHNLQLLSNVRIHYAPH